MALKMINDNILIEEISNTTISAGGILLTSIEPPSTGKVISVGPGKVLSSGVLEEHNLEIGDVVIFGKSSLNTPIEDDGKKYYVMKINDIFGKKL